MCGLVYLGLGEYSHDQIENVKKSLTHRGPDFFNQRSNSLGEFFFFRLAIMDPTEKGNQPFSLGNDQLVCNGEIYNYQDLKKKINQSTELISGSDCEVLLPSIHEFGFLKTIQSLDAEFALVYYSEKSNQILAARDPIGIRPLFYGFNQKGNICFSSELKSLQGICEKIEPFPPGHIYQNGKFTSYINITTPISYSNDEEENIFKQINYHLTKGVHKRLVSDVPLGFLLSGGLDSSLVCAIAQKKLSSPIKTFSVGMSKDPIDLKYAKEVAEYIGSDHTEIYLDKENVLASIKDVIWHLESFDITTIRASIGMYLICKGIRERTDIKVLLTGEVSDELFGYKYTDFAPSEDEFQKEAKKRVDELYIYDVLRADRCISAHSIEARVPFSDKNFIEYVMSVHPKFKMNTTGVGKYLLRKSFEGNNLLPHNILYRDKAAFSDAVGHSLVDELKSLAEREISDSEFESSRSQYDHAPPISKESLYYRRIFDELFPGQAHVIKSYWMPNSSWENCNVDDPSARVLPNYGKSGN
ncbi:asparagine synthase B [Bacteriovoracaceae bacterium]|nr:asparagine synthase B [Bacteriovoracaceae bacterium]